MVPRFVSTIENGGVMNSRRFQGPILGPPDRIIRLDHARHNRPRGHYAGGKTV